jgi:colicin import membrane protein
VQESFLNQLDRLSQLQDETPREQQRVERTPQTDQSDAPRQAAGAGRQLTVSQMDALRSHLGRCWRMPADMPNPETLQIRVRIRLNRDGSLAGLPQVLDQLAIEASGNPFLKAARDNAFRAVMECNPYSFLPADRYDDWKEIDFTFTPTLY